MSGLDYFAFVTKYILNNGIARRHNSSNNHIVGMDFESALYAYAYLYLYFSPQAMINIKIVSNDATTVYICWSAMNASQMVSKGANVSR